MPFTPDEIEADSLRAQARREKLLASRYLAHPDPRDPDWPGHWLDDEATECKECFGKGFNDEWKAVSGHKDGGEVFREECSACEGTGKAK